MESFPIAFVFLSILFFIPSTFPIAPGDIITQSASIKDGESIVSGGGSFELGFFSPGSSKSRYLGIWYKDISPRIVVWVCNKETPITDHSGALNLTGHGALVLFSGTNTIVWSSSEKTSTNISSLVAKLQVAQLLETGNLVVRDGSKNHILWQSFDYPSDTLLAGMKIGWDSKTGLNRFLSSWKEAEDPSPGPFSYSVDRRGYPQVVLRNGSMVYYRLGSWNGLSFSGLSIGETTAPELFKLHFVLNDNEVYYTFELLSPLHSRLVLHQSGDLQRFTWTLKAEVNQVFITLPLPGDKCDTYNRCGAFSLCRNRSGRLCACLQGFVTSSSKSKRCLRRAPLGCNKHQDGFRKFTMMKLPDTSSSWYNLTMTFEECTRYCLENCSCNAYAKLDKREGGIGCLLWFGELIDIKQFNSGGQDLFVKMANSDLDESKTNNPSSMKKKKKKKKIVIIVSFGLLTMGLLVLALVFYIRKKKKLTVKMKNYSKNLDNEGADEDMEVVTFDLGTISLATDNFSNHYKLGEGGFGPVYKGTLREGKDIAVKRLSKCSGQGIKEFLNEVKLIAKLQHRNLVKLIGCCVEGDEKMLIYEYMPNRSLDYFIFDEIRSKGLLWDDRIKIIGGIARGLLYLHQDSRLRIIHRDLKTSNVLLDKDMNPKISDFGTARAFRGDQTQENTSTVVGTYGYMSPEYMVDGLFSIKSDVFSFGAMVLEIVSGKKNRGFIDADHQLNLLGHAWILWTEGRSLEMMDKMLDDSAALIDVSRCIHIGLLCVQEQPEDRPNMASVVLMLGGEGLLPAPKQPGFFTRRNPYEGENSSSSKLESVNEMSMTLFEAR